MSVTTFLDTTAIHQREPSLASYYPTGYTSWSTQITEAKRVIIQRLKNNGKDIKKYCTPFYLQQTSATFTTGEYSTATSEEGIERMIFAANVTAGTGTLTLYGSNDLSTWDTVTTLTITTTGTTDTMFETPYKYYKFLFTGTTITLTAYLIESSFYLAHLYLSLSLIYRMLETESEGFWEKKSVMYNDMYLSEIESMLASYDDDLDGNEDASGNSKLTETWFSR